MSKKIVSLCLLLVALAAAVGGVALADDNPTIAFLRFGPELAASYTEDAILGEMQVFDYISEEELVAAQAGEEITGEHVNLLWGDADFDLANVGFIVDRALDQGADILVTFSTPVTQAALHASSDMDDPPAIFFTQVYNPFEAGIAQSACIKPDHVTGMYTKTRYEDVIEVLLLQDPDLGTLGILYSGGETSGNLGAEEIAAAAQSLGLEVVEAAIVGIADLSLAAEALIAKGAEIIVSPADTITARGLPTLLEITAENAVPLVHSTFGAVTRGATVAAGSSQYSFQVRRMAAMVLSYLAGDLDIAATGISALEDFSVAVNSDTAEAQGVVISDALMDRVSVTLADGKGPESAFISFMAGLGGDDAAIQAFIANFAKLSLERDEIEFSLDLHRVVSMMSRSPQVMAENADFIAKLQCTDEMIAEQQAQLEAADG